MSVAVALFTRDLRTTDNPVLAGAANADRVIPVFVVDDVPWESASPNRRWAIAGALQDLRTALQDLGGDLVGRRGDTVDEGCKLVKDHEVTRVHLASEPSRFGQGRERRLREALEDLGLEVELVVHDSHLVVPPGEVTPTSGDHYKVFTPYFRSWVDATRRPLAETPSSLTLPDGIDVGDLPSPDDVPEDERSPDLAPIGEQSALEHATDWLAGDGEDYEDARDDLAADKTSRFSAPLHFGTLSARWIEEQLDRRKPGHKAFHRQLCWRDFNHQLLAAFPALPDENYRDKGDQWRTDEDAAEAWKQGRTGYPIVDAGMRQLRREGFMHNRTRMIVASFLTKTLYLDWRIGAEHFERWLVDADLANNRASWQWVAGTGTDSRPNRVYNPLRQAERYDPDGEYIRRYVEELAEVEDAAHVREPWREDGTFDQIDYPDRIVDLDEGRDRFLEARGKA